jgi:transketolase
MASGSETALAVEAAKTLKEAGLSIRVVSVPCIDIFEEQDAAYKEAVLPKAVQTRVAVEAGSSLSWGKLAGPQGAYVTMDTFGASAPAGTLFKEFGFTAAHICETVKGLLG